MMNEISKKINVFISYASKDSNLFRIKDIAFNLKKFNEIKEVYYWEENLKDNIFTFMNNHIAKCDVFLLFCTPNILLSTPIEKEWTAADALNKPILPIFLKLEFIPPLLRSRIGIEFDISNFENNIHNIYSLIMKKFSSTNNIEVGTLNSNNLELKVLFKNREIIKSEFDTIIDIQKILKIELNPINDLEQQEMQNTQEIQHYKGNFFFFFRENKYINKFRNLSQILTNKYFTVRNGHVVNLYLSSKVNNIKFSKSLESLKKLEILSIKGENIEFPNSFFKFENLKAISIDSINDNHLKVLIKNSKFLEIIIIEKSEITEIPNSIVELINLKVISIIESDLKSLPNSICNLENLIDMDFKKNKIEQLPENIGLLRNLERLDISNNKLGFLPTSFEKLLKLKDIHLENNNLEFLSYNSFLFFNNTNMLKLENNNLKYLPDSIGELKGLRIIHLSKNKLQYLPETIGKLEYLEHLTITDNDLIQLPTSINELKSLKTLTLNNNRLNALPSSLKYLKHLERLYVINNQLDAIADLNDKIEYLELGFNKFIKFPNSVLKLHNLVKLNLMNNSIENIPNEILNLENLATLNLLGNPLNKGSIVIVTQLNNKGCMVFFDQFSSIK